MAEQESRLQSNLTNQQTKHRKNELIKKAFFPDALLSWLFFRGRQAISQKYPTTHQDFKPNEDFKSCRGLGCHKCGFKRWGFKEIGGNLRKKALCLRCLDFPGAVQALWKRAKKAEKRAKKADFGRFPGRAARRPLNPHLLHPHLRQPKRCCQEESQKQRLDWMMTFSSFHFVSCTFSCSLFLWVVCFGGYLSLLELSVFALSFIVSCVFNY